MRGRNMILSVSAAALLPCNASGAAIPSDPTGIWLNDTGRGAVEITMCGNALCGHVVWVKENSDLKGCGKQIIGDVGSVGNGRWDNGWIYSPERGRRYGVEITPLANGTLRVTGYSGLKFLSKTMIWKRAPVDLPRCSATDTKAPQKPGLQADVKPTTPKVPGVASSPSDTDQAATSDDKTGSARVAAVSPASTPGDNRNTSKTDTPAVPDTTARPEQISPLPNDQSPAAEDGQEGALADDGELPEIVKTINGLGLGKVVSKTTTGKCKLDLPWVKVTIDCER